MAACSLARSHTVLVQCLSGDVLVGLEDEAVGMVLYKSGVSGLGRGNAQ